MIKLIAKGVIISVLLTLVGCSNTVAVNETTDEPIQESQVLEEVSQVEVAQVEETELKVEPSQPKHDVKDTIKFDITSSHYNDKGQLVVTGNLVNTTDYRVTTLRIRRLEIFNENEELVASECFGYDSKDFVFTPRAVHETSYTFPSITVKIKDDDLNDLTTSFDTSAYVRTEPIEKVSYENSKGTYGRETTEAIEFEYQDIRYNDKGEIVVSGILTNKTVNFMGHIKVNKMTLKNDQDQIIASNAFGYLDFSTIEAKSQREWTFVFPSITVALKDADLENIKVNTKIYAKF